MNPLELYLLFLKASVLSFGGLSSLPMLHQDLIARGASEALIGQGLAIGRISPGPNVLYIVSLGYELGGLTGALAAWLAVLQPPFSVLLTAASYARLSSQARTQNALLVVGLALAGSIGYTAWQITANSAIDVAGWLVAAAAFAITAATRWHPMIVIAAAGVCGIIIYR